MVLERIKQEIFKRQKVLLLLIAGVGSSLFQWLFICVMTKIFDVEVVGIYSGAVAIITPVVTFANLSLRSMQVTDVNGIFSIENSFALKRITALIAGIVCIFLFLYGKTFVLGVLILQLLILSSKVANMFSDAAYGYLIRKSMTIKYTISVIAANAGAFICFSVSALLLGNVYFSLLLYSLPYLLVFYIYDLRNVGGKKAWNNAISKADFIFISKMCLPLALVQTINTLYDSIPKLVLEKYFGNSELGVYSAISYISLAGGIVVTAITTGYATELAMHLKNGQYRTYFGVIAKEILAVAFVCLSVFCVFLFWGKPIITLLYSPIFADYIDVILILIVAVSLNFISRVLGTACTAARLNNNQLATAVICVTVLTLVSLIFIPKYGIVAAALAGCCAYSLKILILLGVIFWNLFVRKSNKLLDIS